MCQNFVNYFPIHMSPKSTFTFWDLFPSFGTHHILDQRPWVNESKKISDNIITFPMKVTLPTIVNNLISIQNIRYLSIYKTPAIFPF